MKQGVADYWGWQDTGKDKYCMIYPSWVQFTVCFPYGYEALEERGEGKAVRLLVVEIL